MRSSLTKVLAAAAALGGSLACGGNGGSAAAGNQVAGTIAGQSFAAQDAASGTGTWNGFMFSNASLAIQLSDYAGQCAYDGKNQIPPLSQLFDLVLATTDAAGGSAPPTSPGQFTVIGWSAPAPPNSLSAQAWYEKGGTGPSGSLQCFRASSHGAVSGKVVLTAVSGSRAAGTFDVVLDSGDHLTGSFDAPVCAGLNLNQSPTCP